MNLLWKTFSETANFSALHSSPRRKPPPNIPEILELIFSYLDDCAIRHSVVHVCRQWYLINQNRLAREVVWYQNWDPSRKQRALQMLPGAARFYYCHITGDVFTGERIPLDENLLHALYLLEPKHQQHLRESEGQSRLVPDTNSRYHHLKTARASATKKSALYMVSFLRDMDVYLGKPTQKSLDTFALPTSLTKLTIRASFLHRAQCDLGSLLLKCPLLEEFYAEGHGMRESSTVVMSFWWPKERQELYPRPFLLRSLVLSNIAFAQPELEVLLRLTPNLKELKLVAMMLFYNKMSFDWTRLFGSLKANNITLDKAHFSTFGTRMSEVETELLLSDVYPKASLERSLWAIDVTPQLLQGVFLQPNTLTTLEVLWKAASLSAFTEERIGPALVVANKLVHQYLCDSPHLVHLTTLKAEVQLEDLDLFHRAGYTGLDRRRNPTPEEINSDNSPLPAAIWGCQGLRTLHIVIHAPIPFHPVHSRILFGYISRVCPVLEDLQVSIPQACHDPYVSEQDSPEYYLQIKGGLCLLSRLQRLRRLKIVSDPEYTIKKCEDWDLNWMLPSEFLCTVAREKRRREIASWNEWKRNEYHIEMVRTRAWRPRRNDTDSNNYHSSSTTDTPILERLQDLGLLQDVKDMMCTEGPGAYRPMPSLERLSFNYPILLRPEEELKRMFSHSKRKK
ncbi:hypothetical protein EC957_010552 [Mortierella hygrophila]|uniref:F-box domain-containing protein n=1 Tax=Mortierella hygrophila TaxID=979708 RepID=A0A9P6K3W6_9FUNG|nr:hypothetical protein EC957_010552 [Mortierella hygrophila]